MLVCSGAANGRVKVVFRIWLSITCFKISASLLKRFFFFFLVAVTPASLCKILVLREAELEVQTVLVGFGVFTFLFL